MAKHPELFNKKLSGGVSGHGVEAASQSYVRGNFVYNVSGAITETPEGTNLILGIAESDATGVTSAATRYTEIAPDDILVMSVVDGSSSDVDYAVSNLTVGDGYGLEIVSSVHCVDGSDTTNALFHYIGPVQSIKGETPYRGYFHVTPTYLQTEVGI